MTPASVSSYDLSRSIISHPPSSLAGRRPPSISSRSTTSRRHRSNRSHHGGSSSEPQNEFPNFAHTGDVEIIIHSDGQEKRYMLHRLILAQCSGFFDAGTSEEWSQAQAQSQGQISGQASGQGLARIGEDEEESQLGRAVLPGPPSGPKLRWRYELCDEGVEDDEMPMLVQKPSNSSLFGGERTPRPPAVRNKPTTPSTGFFRSMANLSAMQSAIHIPQLNSQVEPDNDIIRNYDNMFRIFYNYAPALDSVNIAETYIQCKGLLNLADMYDALEVVGPRIDHHLLQFGSRLWKQVAKYPPSYLKLGYLARSKVIFAEALVHVVGQWPSGSSLLRNKVPDAVIELIEDKYDDLQDLKARIEILLFRLTLTNSRGERMTPSNSYIDFLAVSLFRQWLAENTTPPPAPISKSPTTDGRQPVRHRPHSSTISSGRIYRLIGTGGSSYLPREELKRFLKIRPDEYRDNMKKFERRMEELKSLAREMVKPLMRNSLQLDLGRDGGGLGYLTCTKVEEADFPWD